MSALQQHKESNSLSSSMMNNDTGNVQGGSNITGTDLYVNKPHCAAAVRP